VVAPLAADRRFRVARDPAVFTAVLRTVPACAAWLDVMDPITDVFPMGGLHNTLRRLVVDGRPVATGLHAVGDSVCTTNPTLGRGLALALTGAADLADTLAGSGGDPARCYDPVAFRAFWTINGMLCPPEEVYTDPHVVACTREALSRAAGSPAAQPTRQQLLAALSS
jgi:hypothetical protein